MCGRLYLDTMHVDRANLIVWYLSIWWSDLETGHTIAIIRTWRSFLWYAMNELMYVMQSWILGIWLVTLSHLHWLNHGWKIECLQSPFPIPHSSSSFFFFYLLSSKNSILSFFFFFLQTSRPLHTFERRLVEIESH